ncbi:MAG TPA: hypothetical protein DET40_20100 [Lentisphaeria bacterium]|nr:MAG: hypothetical protein A2X45_24100 [Lentisphaerae bacterium GWF2_50_93]HCE45854.1 hypothetical protein [Lentisphaeria bacterium]
MKFDILNYKFGRFSAAVAVMLVWACIYLPGLGSREVQGNEPKRTMPAISMIQSGNWITPELAGEKYYKKPPLINWMIATSFKLTGSTDEFSARLPSALSILFFALLIVVMPSGFLGIDGKIISSIIFLTTLGIIDKGRLIEIDGAYAGITGMAVLAWLNYRSLNSSRWLLWMIPGIILGLGLLLKGPLILVFFYSVVFFCLYYERKLRELRSFHHAAGITVMVLVFSIWAVTVLISKQSDVTSVPGNAPPVASKMSSEWLSDILDNVIGMDSLKGDKPWWAKLSKIFFSWSRDVLQGLCYFLPWLLFIPSLRREKIFEKLHENEKIIVKSLFWAIVVGVACLMMQPGVRARYFVPLIALSSVMTGFMLSRLQDNSGPLRTWRNTVLALSIISAFGLAVGIFLVSMRFIAKIFEILKVKPPLPLDYTYYLPELLTSVLTAAFLVYFFKKMDKFTDSLKLSLASAGIAIIIVFQICCFVFPVIRQFEVKRPAGIAINRAVPPGETLFLYNFGISNYTPFIYYIRQPTGYLFEGDELTGKEKYILFEKGTFGGMVNDYNIASRDPRLMLELAYKKKKYVIIRFEKPPPKIPGLN